jgi:C-terminal processing protease CtpA/Prc
MKIRALIITLTAAALGTGGVYQLLCKMAGPPAAEDVPVQQSRITDPENKNSGIERDVSPAPLPRPKPTSVRKVNITPAKATSPAASNQPKRNPPKPPDSSRYWELQARRFNGLLEQFVHEQDPSRRRALIQALAGFVRSDTLGTLDWAMSLQDPDEQKAALEAINKSSVSGIGARIETDETGFPKIRETTVLSAIAATGLVEPGDYITGMIDPDGQPVSFENLSIQQVVKHLRGQPGSEVHLLMERVPSDGIGESHTFDVSVQRSLLVIQPPY